MTQPQASTSQTPLNVQGRLRFRRDWAEAWVARNPILRDGEPGYDKSNNMLKVGDGITPWNDLDYLTPPDGGYGPIINPTGPSGSSDLVEMTELLQNHIRNSKPHTIYDDGPSLLLLYQNAKV